jgi:glycosyltransferase involved in cell wall biosynthesis
MKASVIVCTYNRSKLLSENLKSLIGQDFNEPFEIIVVDNNSSDNTRQVVRELAKAPPKKIIYSVEEKQGLSHARNKGIDLAGGEIIAFIDDDAIADKSWLSNLVSVYEDPNVGCAGGRVELEWQGARPDWLPVYRENYLGRLDYGEEIIELKFPKTPFGLNMSFRKAALNPSASFSPELGRSSTNLLSNEEVELCYKVEKAGWKIIYVPKALVKHKVHAERLVKSWFYHRSYWQGRSDAIVDLRNKKYAYSKLKRLASEMARRKTAANPDEFEMTFRDRDAKGYLHHLIESGQNRVSRLRPVETFVSSILKESGKMVSEKNLSINELKSAVRDRDEKISRHQNLADKFEKADSALKRIEELSREQLMQAQARFKELESSLKRIEEIGREELKKKDELLRGAEKELAETRERLKAAELIIDLERTAKKRLEGELKSRQEVLNAVIQEKDKLEQGIKFRDDEILAGEKALAEKEEIIKALLGSMSWKITKPLRFFKNLLSK